MNEQMAYFGAGCFWGVEQAFRQLEGVVETAVGYQGGRAPEEGQTVDYQSVCTGQTGHAEVVRVRFDPRRLSYEQLLEVFWNIHDPTQVDGQGVDRGTQYRSIIFAENEEQKAKALEIQGPIGERKAFSEAHRHANSRPRSFLPGGGIPPAIF